MAQCAAIKANGERCRGIAKAGCDWCPAHDPGRVEARQRAASKAARSKPNREAADLKRQLSDLYDATLEGTVDKGTAAVLAQIANARTRLLETERRIRETEELEERLAELEERLHA